MSAAIDYMKVYSGIVERVSALRLRRDVSEAEMLLGIVDIEENGEEMKALALAGCENVERFVKRNEICDVARFRSFRAGLHKLGREHALKVGAEATIEGSKLTSAKAVASYVEAIPAWREQHAGAAPSRETATRIRKQLDPIQEVPRSMRQKTDGERLRDEVAERDVKISKLEARVAKQSEEIRELKARNVQLSREVAELQKTKKR